MKAFRTSPHLLHAHSHAHAETLLAKKQSHSSQRHIKKNFSSALDGDVSGFSCESTDTMQAILPVCSH